MSTTVYVCPEHGLIQHVEKADTLVGGEFLFCTISGCDQFVRGPIEVVPQDDRCHLLRDALKRVMRNQARLLEAWAEGDTYDEDSGLVGDVAASREQAKDALGYPRMEHR